MTDERLEAAIMAYNGVWQGWSNLTAANIDECRREAMRAAFEAALKPHPKCDRACMFICEGEARVLELQRDDLIDGMRGMEAAVDRLSAALEPFAKCEPLMISVSGLGYAVQTPQQLTFADFRRARDALVHIHL